MLRTYFSYARFAVDEQQKRSNVYLVNVVAGGVDLLGDQAHHHFVLDPVVGEGVDPPPARGLYLAGDVQVLEDDVAPLVLAASPLQVNLVHSWPQGEWSVFVNCIQNLEFDLAHITGVKI